MDLLNSVHNGGMMGLSVLVYAAPKTGKTAMLSKMDWDKTLLFDFDTDGHLTLTSKGLKPSVISFALLNVKILKEEMTSIFGEINPNKWKEICDHLLEPSTTQTDDNKLKHAMAYRVTMIGKKHLPFFLDGGDLMGGKSRYPILDKLSQLVNYQIGSKYETIIVDNISKLKALMTESYNQWLGRNMSQNDHFAVNKRLKSFDIDLMNIKNSGKTLVVMAWAVHKEVVLGNDDKGDPIIKHITVPDVGGSWSESYPGDFSLCLEARKEEMGTPPKTRYYVSANNKTVGSRVFPLIGDECFVIKKDGVADRSKPYLKPDLNMILSSIKNNSKQKETKW